MDHAHGRIPDSSSELMTGTFAGRVWRDPLIAREGIGVNSIFFEPGAHTYWHSHGDGQFLFIDQGRGVIVTRDGAARPLLASDVVYAPPGEEHWHGAAPDSYLAQTTVSMGTTNWMEPVGPEEYAAGCATADDA